MVLSSDVTNLPYPVLSPLLTNGSLDYAMGPMHPDFSNTLIYNSLDYPPNGLDSYDTPQLAMFDDSEEDKDLFQTLQANTNLLDPNDYGNSLQSAVASAVNSVYDIIHQIPIRNNTDEAANSAINSMFNNLQEMSSGNFAEEPVSEDPNQSAQDQSSAASTNTTTTGIVEDETIMQEPNPDFVNEMEPEINRFTNLSVAEVDEDTGIWPALEGPYQSGLDQSSSVSPNTITTVIVGDDDTSQEPDLEFSNEIQPEIDRFTNIFDTEVEEDVRPVEYTSVLALINTFLSYFGYNIVSVVIFIDCISGGIFTIIVSGLLMFYNLLAAGYAMYFNQPVSRGFDIADWLERARQGHSICS